MEMYQLTFRCVMRFDVVVPFTATSTEQCLQAALNSPSLSVDFNGPKWLKTGEGMFNNRLNTEQ